MDVKDKTILVTGATGQQGGSVAEHLLRNGWHVRAFTRNPSSEAAQRLQAQGVELYQGDMDNRNELAEAMRDVYGVFSVQPPVWDSNAFEEELRLGTNVADSAKEAGVLHFVYASASGAESQSHFRTFAKWEIEKHIREIDLLTTILRLTFFMENYLSPYSSIRNGVYSEAIARQIPVNLLAVDDIGAFVNLAFQKPEYYLKQDNRTSQRLAYAARDRSRGKPIDWTSGRICSHPHRNASRSKRDNG